ncbi:hypothetical protein GBA52_024781 [Prunus armeniaca]|nr:hypothetical protein GBA52_024781 [Prunus armeniaca]
MSLGVFAKEDHRQTYAYLFSIHRFGEVQFSIEGEGGRVAGIVKGATMVAKSPEVVKISEEKK